jgi:threonine synthase
LAFEILSLYIDDIPAADLRQLCAKTYTAEVFGTGEIVPLRHVEEGLWIEALSNGPTLAFKDMAMQLLGNLFEYELARRGESLNILGATSGDTGSAAEYAMRGKKGVRVFMTSPYGRMSPFQQAQMFSLQDANIFNLAVHGVFDDCQDLVKAVSNDLSFKREYKIGTVNSINWARLLAQVVYYFAGYIQATTNNTQRVSFSVPSGNFGNVCAGHVARMMGLPIAKLVVATNENDVLDEFFRFQSEQFRTLRFRFAWPGWCPSQGLVQRCPGGQRSVRLARRPALCPSQRPLWIRQRKEHPRRSPEDDS